MAVASRGERCLLQALLVIAAGFFIAGLWLPVATIEQFYIFDNTISIASGLWKLASDGQLILFVLIVLFSVVLPLLKIAVLGRLLFSKELFGRQQGGQTLARLLELMHRYGRWSMLDVFVVAMLIVGVKLTVIADIDTHLGLYLFTSGVLLIMVVSARVSRWHS
ncbi:paraquat-inducible protein A [Porticoccus sp. W117]|uniref:paraquat-inducible protein A n=1 Tax=Porticoccus sp. W117 TaxID=3054777 RepID=UPI002596CC49|nr:paraquat-inducible protein A [Porticoccus sp. W117]MDM3871107.1 paraquat-inducible protein A [Porticoccus sp. W117]